MDSRFYLKTYSPYTSRRLQAFKTRYPEFVFEPRSILGASFELLVSDWSEREGLDEVFDPNAALNLQIEAQRRLIIPLEYLQSIANFVRSDPLSIDDISRTFPNEENPLTSATVDFWVINQLEVKQDYLERFRTYLRSHPLDRVVAYEQVDPLNLPLYNHVCYEFPYYVTIFAFLPDNHGYREFYGFNIIVKKLLETNTIQERELEGAYLEDLVSFIQEFPLDWETAAIASRIQYRFNLGGLLDSSLSRFAEFPERSNLYFQQYIDYKNSTFNVQAK